MLSPVRSNGSPGDRAPPVAHKSYRHKLVGRKAGRGQRFSDPGFGCLSNRLHSCRIYEMTDNKTARSTIANLIVRDQAHENGYAKSLGGPRCAMEQGAPHP